MKWGQPQFLWLLASVPVLVALVVWMQRRSRKAWQQVTDEVVWPQAFAERSRSRSVIAMVFWLTGLALALVAVARPQYGASTVKQTRRGLDLVVALDTSKSMLARDLAPDRLSRAKLELSALLDQLQGDRVGLIAFAGDAFVQCPLTSDYGAAKVFLRALDTNTIPRGGTAIGSAINAADKLLTEARERGGAKSQILILITDGEDHDAAALPAAKALTEKGVTIFTVGVGSAAGEPIPVSDDKGRFTGYMKDRQGNTVLTRLNEEILKQIADAGHGRYVASGGGAAGIEQLIPDLAGFEREEHEAKFKVVYTDRFQWALVPGIALLMIGLFLPRRRSRIPMTILLLALLGGRAEAGVPLLTGKNSDVEAANKQLAANKPDDAIKGYEAAQKELGNRAELFINQGLALEKKGDHKGAKPMLERALMSNDASVRSRAHYLMGNGAFDDKDYPGAIEEFKKALREQPRNQDAKYNLELSQKLLKEQQEQQKKDEKNQKKDDKQKQDQKKDDKKDQKDQGDNKKDEPKPQDQKDPKDQKDQKDQKSDQPKPGEEQQQPPQPKPEASDKDKQRDQLLDALKSEEKALRYNVFQTPKQRKQQPVEKDW